MKSLFHISAIQDVVYLYSLGFSCPSSSVSSEHPSRHFPIVLAPFGMLSSFVQIQLNCVLPCSRCGVGMTAVVFWQLHHPVDSFTPLKSLSVNYCWTQVGRKYCTDGTKNLLVIMKSNCDVCGHSYISLILLPHLRTTIHCIWLCVRHCSGLP